MSKTIAAAQGILTSIATGITEARAQGRQIKTVMLTEGEIIELAHDLQFACPLGKTPTVQELKSGECIVMGCRIVERETTLKFKL